MRKTFGALLIALFTLAAGSAFAADDPDGSGPSKTECVQGCQDDSTACEKICKQQAGEMAGRCVKACKDEQRSCEKECSSPESTGSENGP